MKIYNIFFNTNERKSNAGWNLAYNGDKLLLTANIEGMVKTVISSTLELRAKMPELGDISNRDFKKNINIIPGFKTAKLGTVQEGNNNGNFVLYMKAEAGKTISSIKLDHCSVVMSNIHPNRTEAALVVVVHDINKFRLRVYQADGKLLSVDKSGFKFNVVKHDVKPSKVLRPTVYIQLPEKIFFTSKIKSDKATEMIGNGYTPIYLPLFLVKNKVLEFPVYNNPQIVIDENDIKDYPVEVISAQLKDTYYAEKGAYGIR